MLFRSVDEYQDLNPVQHSIIRLLAEPLNNIAGYGDDYQTIYSFRGSRVSLILDFEKEFPNTKVVTLSTNYRSTCSILSLADSVIKQNRNQHHKMQRALRNDPQCITSYVADDVNAEADYIVNNVKSSTRPLRDIAILYRTSTAARVLTEKLLEGDIPYICSGPQESFYEQDVARSVLAYLRLALDPDDHIALTHVLPTMYLNKTNALKHIELSRRQNADASLLDHLLTLPGLQDFQLDTVEQRVSLIHSLASIHPAAAIRLVRDAKGGQYNKYLGITGDDCSPHEDALKEILTNLEESAIPFATVAQYIHHVDGVIAKHKAMKRYADDPKSNALWLMSIHAAKGKEFPVVFLLGCAEGILPHRNALDTTLSTDSFSTAEEALEEECRLAYVGVTRAKDKIFITSPRIYNNKEVKVSRFFLGAFSL